MAMHDLENNHNNQSQRIVLEVVPLDLHGRVRPFLHHVG